MDVSASWVGELIVENWWVTNQGCQFRDNWEVEWLLVNVYECKSPLPSAVEF
jgi:hypothetical protein